MNTILFVFVGFLWVTLSIDELKAFLDTRFDKQKNPKKSLVEN